MERLPADTADEPSGRYVVTKGVAMPKGLFTQTVCVLMKQPASLQRLEHALSSFPIQGRQSGSENWAFGGPSVTLAFRPEVNGYAVADTVDQPWPDHMGDPRNAPTLFGAWTMGQFGPLTFPGGLQRASQQCWAWESGKTVAGSHKGFIRLRSSYVLGARDDAPVIPPSYDPVPELEFLTDAALAVLELPEALCYFNPSGEVLQDRVGLRESLAYARSVQLLPLDVWSNVRLFNLEAGWFLMDTVGNGQLDLPDIEAGFSQSYDSGEVDTFLRNVSWYLYQAGEVIQDGDTIDGPGNVRWRAVGGDSGVAEPPRKTLRWLPLDGTEVPHRLLER